MTNELSDPNLVLLTFGRYSGTRVGEVPRQYLEWLVENLDGKAPDEKRIVAAAKERLGAWSSQT
jgi:hypothetical protein